MGVRKVGRRLENEGGTTETRTIGQNTNKAEKTLRIIIDRRQALTISVQHYVHV